MKTQVELKRCFTT